MVQPLALEELPPVEEVSEQTYNEPAGLEEVYEEPEPADEPEMSEEKKAQKSLLMEMRSLLRDYPMKLDLRQVENLNDLVHDLLLIYDLLVFVSYKTLKEEIKALAQAELAEFDNRISIREIRRLWMKTNRKSHFANRCGNIRVENLLRYEMNFIADKVQFFSLAVPSKDKPYMHLKNAQGLSAANADEYESSEIQEGEKVGPETAFKVDEGGRVIPLN